MAVRRSTQLVVIGVSVFIIGAGLVFVGLRSGDGKDDAAAKRPVAAAPSGSPAPRLITVQAGTQAAPVSIPIPKDHTAVAVPMDRVAGLAGYATPGDIINVYANVKKKGADQPVTFTKLVLTNVKVIDVKGGEEVAGDLTYLLALSADDAETAIHYAKFESLWAALVPAGTPKAETAGVTQLDGLSALLENPEKLEQAVRRAARAERIFREATR